MNSQELLKYEMPGYVEYISWNWLQNIIAKRMAKKVSYKIARYNMRKHREQWLKERELIK